MRAGGAPASALRPGALGKLEEGIKEKTLYIFLYIFTKLYSDYETKGVVILDNK